MTSLRMLWADSFLRDSLDFPLLSEGRWQVTKQMDVSWICNGKPTAPLFSRVVTYRFLPVAFLSMDDRVGVMCPASSSLTLIYRNKAMYPW